MIEYLIQILIHTVLTFYLLTILRVLIEYSKNKTDTTLIFIIIFLFLGYGIFYDSIRLLSYIIFGNIDLFLDQFSFFFKLFTVLITYSFLARLVFKLTELSGYNIKKYSYVRIFFVVSAFILSISNWLTSYPSYFYDMFGFYMHMVDPTLRIIIYALYAPFIFFISIKARDILTELKNKTMKRRMIYSFTLFGILMICRLFNLGYFRPFSEYITTYIIDYLIILISLFCLCLIVCKYPEMIQTISIYFSVRSIYIIQKRGDLLFNHNFKKEESQEPISQRQLLIGGFIYAVNKELKSFFDIKGEVNTINFGKMCVLLKHGKHIFGLLTSLENTPLVRQKLRLLIEKFEILYEKELENWNGNHSVFKSEEIQNLIYEIFR